MAQRQGCSTRSWHAVEHQRHQPERTLLYEVVRENLESFLAEARSQDQPAPRFVEQELRAFLRRGVLAHDFLRLHCDDCGHDRLVGRITGWYMRLIDPFRRFIIYPSALRYIRNAWAREVSQSLP